MSVRVALMMEMLQQYIALPSHNRGNNMGQQHESIKMAIKNEFFAEFRRMQAKAGDTLPANWLYNDFMSNLSAKEQKALEEIVSEMIREGLIEYVGGAKPTYAITRKGLERIC